MSAVGVPPLRESFRRRTYVSEALLPGVSIENMGFTSMLDSIVYFVLVIWIGITLSSLFHTTGQRRGSLGKGVVASDNRPSKRQSGDGRVAAR